MASTFLQALKERYEVIRPATGLPAVGEEGWVGVIPDGKASTFPNVVCLHGGEGPPDGYGYQQDLPDGGVAMEEGYAEFRVYAVGLAEAERLAKVIRDGFGMRSLLLDGKDVTLYRPPRSYRVTASARKGPRGEFVFEARQMFRAQVSDE